ncbi:MAG: TRAP transporter small permease [Desulfosalsimonadaceae bacterium]
MDFYEAVNLIRFLLMISLLRINQYISKAAAGINWISAAAVFLMMVVTTGDVALRFFRISIPGAYETIGFLSALAIAFALPYTAVEKGHIAVDFLVQRFSRPARIVVNIINSVFSIFLFSIIAWKSFQYGATLKATGSVSATLEMPIYPFVYGVAAGCILLCPVLFMELLLQFKGVESE